MPVGVSTGSEDALRAHLRDDPNDVEAFARLAEIVRRSSEDSHRGGAPGRGADDAVWALAEELAHSPRAWYPLVEMARLSIDDDREAAMRRLGTAAERDPSGHALALGVHMLRQAGNPADALNLGVGHWRPREHELEVGRQLVEAAMDAGRPGEARRHLSALQGHGDPALPALERELTELLARRAPSTVTLPDEAPGSRAAVTPTVAGDAFVGEAGTGEDVPSLDLREPASPVLPREL